jgi:hypothetical protein
LQVLVLVRRSRMRRATDLGAWMHLFDFLAALGCWFNAALIFIMMTSAYRQQEGTFE